MSQVEETSLERAVNNSINNMQHRLVPPLRGESVMEISSRGQTGEHKWRERKDVRSLSGAGWGVTFQGRDTILKGRAAPGCGGPCRSSGNTLKCHMLVFVLWEQKMACWLSMPHTCSHSQGSLGRGRPWSPAGHGRGPKVKITMMELLVWCINGNVSDC